jgi:ornithine decarboxylase
MIKAINIERPDRKLPLTDIGFRQAMKLMVDNRIKTPFLVLSRSAIRSNLIRLASALPGVGIHYAVKSNCHSAILEEVARTGHSFDIASYRELQFAIEAGTVASDVIHSHPIKSSQEIKRAVSAGVTVFVVDNPDEIKKFVPYAGKVRLLIRFKIEDSKAVVNLSYKFGCLKREVPGLVEIIKRHNLDYCGLAFHVGSQCFDNGVYIKAINEAANLIDELHSNGVKTELLDIGGGFPVPYTDKVIPIEDFCRPIQRQLDKRLEKNIKVICEPGRFISATSTTLVSSIIGKSVRSGKSWYFLDDGVYGSFSGRVYDHCKYQVITNRNTTWQNSVLAGPTCDSFDVIYKDVLLPPLELGDILLFPAMGAYCSVSASSFNSLRKAEYIVVD